MRTGTGRGRRRDLGSLRGAIPAATTRPTFAAYIRRPPDRERRCSSPPTATAPWSRSSAALAVRRDADRLRARRRRVGAERRCRNGVQGALPGNDLPGPAAHPGVRRGGYRLPFARYLFLRIDDVALAASVEIAETNGGGADRRAPWDRQARLGRQRRLRYAGLRGAAAWPDALAGGVSEEFRAGDGGTRKPCSATPARADPSNWGAGSAPLRHPRAGDDQRQAPGGARRSRTRGSPTRARSSANGGPDRRPRERRRRARPAGSSTSATPTASRSRRSRAARSRRTPGQRAQSATATGARSARASSSLGYPDEEGVASPQRRRLWSFEHQRSYMVYRKLRQDVAAFRRGSRETSAALYPGGEELLAAKIVGRWRDGTPIALSPALRPDADARCGRAAQQRVDYGNDPDGLRLSDRRARAARESATQPPVRRQARQPPSADPARDPLRAGAAARGPLTTARTAA